MRNIIGVVAHFIRIKVWRDFNLTFPKLQPHEQRFYTPEEMRQIIDAAKGQWRVLFATLAGTGCRFGEAAGLHIEDLYFTNNTVTIKRGVYRRKEQTPKSRNAYRTVNVDEGLMKDASVVRHTECNLCSAACDRLTFSRMSEALAVQINGFGCSL